MFKLPDLPYEYNALMPYIDEETMHFHHDKHHATYVQNLNDALAGHDDLLNMDIFELIKNINTVVPEEILTKVKNNGGGHANHSMFWEIMGQNTSTGKPKGDLLSALESKFGDFETFKTKFSDAAKGQFGSGWAWLVLDSNGKLEITSTQNQDSPLSLGHKPILLIDVWEHAYYLKYQNKRADYIEAWWNVVNWEEVEKRFKESLFKT